MTDEERADALEMLSAEDLVERILDDFTRCGVVGEETNKLVGYLAAVSRKLDGPWPSSCGPARPPGRRR